MVGAAALVISLYTLGEIRRQNTLITSQRELDTHTLLIDHNAALLELLVQYPDIRPFFYDGASLPETGSVLFRSQTLAEMWTDLFEQVLIQGKNLPEEMADTWRQYALDMYQSSTAIQAYFDEASGWYVPELQRLWLDSSSAEPMSEMIEEVSDSSAESIDSSPATIQASTDIGSSDRPDPSGDAAKGSRAEVADAP